MKIHSQQKHRHHGIFKCRETNFFVGLFRERFSGTEPPNKTTIFRNVKNTLIMVRV